MTQHESKLGSVSSIPTAHTPRKRGDEIDPILQPAIVLERFMAKIVAGEGHCWIWVGSRHEKGYGLLKINGRQMRAHRVSYEHFVGPIPDGLQIDHLCRNPSCVNPTHLEPVTARENTLRGDGVTAQNARKTHCKHGHPLSGANLRWSGSWRVCIACRREISRRERIRRAKRTDPYLSIQDPDLRLAVMRAHRNWAITYAPWLLKEWHKS